MLKVIQLLFGFYPRKIIRNLLEIPWFIRSRKEFRKQSEIQNSEIPLARNFPCLLDKSEEGGSASGHYFHQDLLVAQSIFNANPAKHLDIGSRIDGFVAHVASFREIEVMDIRDLKNTIANVRFVQADCMADNMQYTDYCDSISSLHAIEHFGLGRYGDPIDVNGHLKGLNNIYKMLKKGGIFYFSAPIGRLRIEFNAHRVFSLNYLLDYFRDKYTLLSFSYVDDKGNLHKDVPLDEKGVGDNCGCNYGCGIFTLRKHL